MITHFGLRKASLSREDQTTLLSILDEETNRLNRLVTDLLRYARPVNVQRQHVLLTDLLERGLALARDRKRVKVEVILEVNDLRLWGDANLLRQVFDNLIDNAVQAMGSGGSLTVRVRGTHPDEGTAGGLAVELSSPRQAMDLAAFGRQSDQPEPALDLVDANPLLRRFGCVEPPFEPMPIDLHDPRRGVDVEIRVGLPIGHLSLGRFDGPDGRLISFATSVREVGPPC